MLLGHLTGSFTIKLSNKRGQNLRSKPQARIKNLFYVYNNIGYAMLEARKEILSKSSHRQSNEYDHSDEVIIN